MDPSLHIPRFYYKPSRDTSSDTYGTCSSPTNALLCTPFSSLMLSNYMIWSPFSSSFFKGDYSPFIPIFFLNKSLKDINLLSSFLSVSFFFKVYVRLFLYSYFLCLKLSLSDLKLSSLLFSFFSSMLSSLLS